MRLGRSWSLALVGALISVCLVAEAVSPVARVASFSGTVKVQRESGVTAPVRMMGAQVRGGTLMSGDTVLTGPNSSATIQFDDQSKLDLGANASVRIRQSAASPAKVAESGKTVLRSMKIINGKVLANIRPNLEVATEFELPTGVAAVRGTVIRFSVDGQNYEAEVMAGQMQIFPVVNGQRGAAMTVVEGGGLRVQAVGNTLVVTATSGSTPITVNNASLSLDATDNDSIVLGVTPTTGELEVTNNGTSPIALVAPDGTTATLDQNEHVDVAQTGSVTPGAGVTTTAAAPTAPAAPTPAAPTEAAPTPVSFAGGGAGGGGGGGSPAE